MCCLLYTENEPGATLITASKWYQENSDPENSHPWFSIFPPTLFVFFFLFINVNRYHCCWLSLIIGNYYNIPVGSNVFIFEASHEECYITQFNQLNLNSCFSIWLLITWLVCWFIWKQLLRVGLLYNIKVIENTAKQ